MDGLAQALQSIAKPVGEVATAGSTAYNLYNQWQNQKYQDQLRSFAQDPAKMNAYAAKFTQPLTAGLTTGVANQAQADLATRGLTDSPEISQQVYAQAIAPYIQQNQQQGYQDALQALQVGGGAVNPNTQSPNTIAALAKAFSMIPGGAQPPNGLQALQNYLRTMGTQQPQININGGVGAPPGPIDTSGLDTGMPDTSAFSAPPPDVSYTPDYLSAVGADSGN